MLMLTFILLFVSGFSMRRFSGRISDSRLVWGNMKLHCGGELFTNRVIVRTAPFSRHGETSVTGTAVSVLA
jgi:hypothetical protein